MSKKNAHTYTFTSFYDAGRGAQPTERSRCFPWIFNTYFSLRTKSLFMGEFTDFIDTYGYYIIVDRHVRLRLSWHRKIYFTSLHSDSYLE